MIAHLYKLTCITNMHVGNGEVNYSIIDNEVQRDPVLGTPMIFSSSVKGALRSHMTPLVEEDTIRKIFGGDKNNMTMGEYKFFSANMISRPLRVSCGESPYVNATSKTIISNHLSLMQDLGIKIYKEENKLPEIEDEKKYCSSLNIDEIEGEQVKVCCPNELLKKIIGENWALTNNETLLDIPLPVIARNELNNGKSNNLWYEEIVPHKSIFYFVILTPSTENLLDERINGQIVQFGANASVGYGYSKVEKVGHSYE